MRGSSNHILTSHAGSLPRPDALIEAWGANDEPALSFELRAAVAEVAHRLAELAIAGNVDAAVPLAAHTEVDAFLTNCRIADGRLVDIGIAGGKIAVVGEGAASPLSNSAPALDIDGDLVLPGLVDGHMHLDKTLTGLPWMGHAAGPTRMSRIETDKLILPNLPLSTEERAGNLIRECVTRGTTHLRTHVDIDLENGLAKLDGVLAARERYRDRVTVQVVAFPQSGVMRCPGVLDCSMPRSVTVLIWSAVSIRWKSIATPRGSSTASSRSRRGTGSASTSTCTSPARWASSMSRRFVPAPRRWVLPAR
jgi:hypothetical protein